TEIGFLESSRPLLQGADGSPLSTREGGADRSARIPTGRSRDVSVGAREPVPGTRKDPGDDLFSRGAAPSVSSALESLTSVFGMGTGMASPLVSPGFVSCGRCSGWPTLR